MLGREVVAHLARERRGEHRALRSAEERDVVARRVERAALARDLRAGCEEPPQLAIVVAALEHGEHRIRRRTVDARAAREPLEERHELARRRDVLEPSLGGVEVVHPAPQGRRRASPLRQARPFVRAKAADTIILHGPAVERVTELDRRGTERQALGIPLKIHRPSRPPPG